MTKITCDIARDLMPLVIDGIASEDSCAALHAHIADCAACADAFAAMQATEPQPAQKDTAFVQFCRKVKRKSRSKTIAIALLSLCLCAIIGRFGYYWVDDQINTCRAEASPNCAAATLSIDSNTNLVCTITPDPAVGFWDYRTNHWAVEWLQSDDTVLYITPTEPEWLLGRTGSTDTEVITLSNFYWTDDELHCIFYDYKLIEENGETVAVDDPSQVLLNKIVREVRWGNPDDYVTLYTAGDILPQTAK